MITEVELEDGWLEKGMKSARVSVDIQSILPRLSDEEREEVLYHLIGKYYYKAVDALENQDG